MSSNQSVSPAAPNSAAPSLAAPSPQAGSAGGPAAGPEPAFLLLDSTSRIIAAHPTCAALFGRHHDELVGLQLEVLLKHGTHNEIAGILQSADPADQSAPRISVGAVILRRDGTELPTRVTLKRWWRNAQFCWTAVFQQQGSDPQSQAAVVALPSTQTGHERPADQVQNFQVTLHSKNETAKPPTPSAQSRPQQELMAKHEKDRAMLVQRIYTAETELYEVRAELERVNTDRQALQKKLDELAAGKTDLERRLAEQAQSQSAAGLERLQADQQQQSQEWRRVEADLRGRLEAASAATEQSATALKEKECRCAQLEEELAGVRQGRDELERQQRQGAAELERAKADLQQQSHERQRIESDLRGQLDAAKAAAEQSASAFKETEGRCAGLEEDLGGVRQVRDELERQLHQSVVGLERAKAETEQQTHERQRLETELRGKLEAAQAAAEQNATALKVAEDRCARLEDDLAGVRQVRDELERQLNQSVVSLESARADAQQQSQERQRIETELRDQLDGARAAADQNATALKESDGRCARFEEELLSVRSLRDDLEQQQRQNTAKLERTKAELQQQAQERQRIETELREQLDGAKTAAEQNASALKESDGRCARFQEELLSVRSLRDDLEQQQRQTAAELERAKADLQQQTQERQRIETELREQLDGARAAAEQNATALKESDGRCARFEEELLSVRSLRDDLEQQQRQNTAELERTKAELQQQAQERQRIETELREQLDGAKTAAEQNASALKESDDRCARFEEELLSVRSLRDDLEQQQRQNTAELERAKAELQQQAQERQRIETELRDQLDGAKTAAEQNASALKESDDRCARFEEELLSVRSLRDDLEQQQRQNTAELERAKAELQQQARERQQSEAELRAQLDAAKALAAQTASVLEEKAARCTLQEEALLGVRRMRDELEQQQRQAAAELERAQAELQQQAQERQRVEAELRSQLDATHTAAEQSAAALKSKTSRCAELEEELISVRRLRDDLDQQQRENAAGLERAKAGLLRQSEELRRLETELRSLAEEKESLRQELSGLLDSRKTESPAPVETGKQTSAEAAPPVPASNEPASNDGEAFCLTAPAAREVWLAGDFTNWKERAIPMQKNADGNWTAAVKLPPGTYDYLFIVDHEWRSDPACASRVSNQFGSSNSVRQVA